jgi:hypothetical protein
VIKTPQRLDRTQLDFNDSLPVLGVDSPDSSKASILPHISCFLNDFKNDVRSKDVDSDSNEER